jgi:predicted DNA-binding protein (MmcQ/YjbR family)
VTWDDLVAHALAKPGAWADEPWGEGDRVIKVGTKIFMFCGSGAAVPQGVSLRCQPDDVEAWRARYPGAIGPAPYMRTRPWNRVVLDGSVDEDDLLTLVDDSYDSVVARLPKRDRPPGWAPPPKPGR